MFCITWFAFLISSSDSNSKGAPKRTFIIGRFIRGIGKPLPSGHTLSLPVIATGTIVAPVARAIREIPGRHCPTPAGRSSGGTSLPSGIIATA